jgi:hypothetical protein
MELIYSLLFSQDPATCLYPEPDQSSPRPQMFLKVQFNIIVLSPTRSSKWCLSLRFPNQHPVCTFPLPPPFHVPCAHPPPFWFDHPNNIWWGVEIFRLLIMQSPPVPSYLVTVRPRSSSVLNSQPKLFTQWSHLTASSNRQNSISVDLHPYIFGYKSNLHVSQTYNLTV